jgi:hypothetical protein
MKTPSRLMKEDSWETQHHKTDRLTPDSSLPPNADSALSHHRRYHSLVYMSFYQSRPRQNVISVFFSIAEAVHSYSQS